MTETVYQEPAPASQAQQPARARRDWKDQPPWVWISAATLVVVVIAALIYLDHREPAPVILGASSRSLAISSNGELLAVGTLDGTLRLVSTQTGHTLAHTLLPAPAMAVSFGPEGSVLALVLGQTTLYIFDKD